ncbi:MAG TPA: hypothetical protein VFB96_22105 [Pirellulaceae bacterium]|nr:hypothetical protein [Pirellulaceae bacterium]
MKRRVALLAIAIFAVVAGVRADYSVADKGLWPETWPLELEGLRKQAKTYEGPLVLTRRYLIPFTKREEFEAAWPHILKVKSKGAPIILVRGPKTDFFKIEPAGVLIQTPPVDQAPEAGDVTVITLVVDGKIVDLNRIELPADTPIVDERFKK